MSIWSKIFNKITFKDYPDTSTPLNATNLNTMTDAIDGLDDRVLQILGDFAGQYDNFATYSVGDYAIYDGMLYKCIIAITVAEEWDSSKWQQTDCGSEFNQLNSNLDLISNWKDITGNSNLGYYTATASSKIYKNEALRVIFAGIYISGKVTNQSTIATLGLINTMTDTVSLLCGLGTCEENVTINIGFDGANIKSSHSQNLQATNPRYIALFKY